MWGPLVPAGELGPEPPPREGPPAPGAARPPQIIPPVFVAAEQPVAQWVKPVAGKPGQFRTDGVVRMPGASGAANDVELVPFYRLHRRTYAVYWDLFPPHWFRAGKK